MANSKTKNPPVSKIRVKTVKVAIFANVTDKGTYYSAKPQIGFKKTDGSWANGDSYNLDGLFALEHATRLAIDEMIRLRNADQALDAQAEEMHGNGSPCTIGEDD